ncbi:MAG: transglycosylase SLT domain-containing protein [Bacteroidales bacterium]|nr:transglycosylase SLT domain-containing protein [Bacteroidales bacterium]
MRRKHSSLLFLIVASLILATVVLVHGHGSAIPKLRIAKLEKKRVRVHGDTLSVCLFYHAADYFVYQGSVIGFQHDVLKQLEKDLQRPVNIVIESDPEKMFLTALSNQYDIICFDFDKTNYNPFYITVSEPVVYTYPVLIMRKKDPAYDSVPHVVNTAAKYYNKLDFSMLEDSLSWRIQHNPDLAIEDLMDMLVDGQIDYAVCNYNEAITLMPFYTQLTIGPRVGDNFARTWILNRSNGKLNDTINNWLVNFKETNKYQSLCEKYLSPHSYVISRSFGRSRNSTSYYDGVLKKASARYGFDWRLISAIIYQESRFIPDLVGFGGSFGVMQMMPTTCERYGITDSSSVEDQIWAGAKYISFLCNIFRDKVDTADLYYFVAGAYNSGPGHILDAIALCEKYGGDQTKWVQTAEYLIKKSHKEYYRDEVVKCGYYPGKHTVNYVEQVMTRYNGFTLSKE